MNAINSISVPQSASQLAATANDPAANGPSFKDMLIHSVEQVNSMQLEADQAVETMFSGGDVNPAEVLTAVQKADLAFRLTMQMRNKLMEVYQEIKDIRI